MRNEIFALRKDPTANAMMAGAFANSNAKVLTDRLGRKPTDGELYMAHFLGASGASRFIRAAEANPNAKAAAFFPRAAHANNSIFYDKVGQARSLKQVYAGLVSRHNVIGNTQIAEAKSSDAVQSASLAAPLPRARPLLPEAPPSPMINVAMVTPAAATSAAPAPPPRQPMRPQHSRSASRWYRRQRRAHPDGIRIRLREPAAAAAVPVVVSAGSARACRAGRARTVGRAPRGADRDGGCRAACRRHVRAGRRLRR